MSETSQQLAQRGWATLNVFHTFISYEIEVLQQQAFLLQQASNTGQTYCKDAVSGAALCEEAVKLHTSNCVIYSSNPCRCRIIDTKASRKTAYIVFGRKWSRMSHANMIYASRFAIGNSHDFSFYGFYWEHRMMHA